MSLRKVLIVDDHPVVRRVLRQIFEETREFELVADAATAEQALSIASTALPALAVVDMRLPDEDGLELIPRLLSVSPATRILVFSSVDERAHGPLARKAGAHGFVSKGKEPDELLASARLVLAGYTCYTSGEPGQPGASLSVREMAVLKQLVRGISNVDIAASLNVSPKTVSTYKARVLQKLDLKSVVDLVEYAKSNGLAD
jgi:two-component system response regulator FimZ (fimbrial Z protein)